MLNFIKKLFAKEELKQESIPLNKLDRWHEEKTKDMHNKLNNELKVFNDKIINEIEKAGENIIALEKATLKNPKITLREQQFMEGNRLAYIKKTSFFLKQIDLPKNINSIKEFLTNFNSNIENFSKNAAKPYRILQEFFANESSKLAQNIGNIDRNVKELKRNIEEVNLDSAEEIKENIKNININIEKKKTLTNKLKDDKTKLEDLNKSITTTTKDINELEESKEYRELLKLKEEKQKLIDELDNHKKNLTHSFSVLERALKKFSRIVLEDEKLVIAYLEKPILALRKDSELKILKILDNLESSISNNTINLKDSKRKKTIDEIRILNKEYFESFLSKYTDLINKITSFDKKVITSKVEREKETIEKELKTAKNQKEKIEQDIKNINTEIEKINIEKEKKKIEDEIERIIKVKINIS